MSNEYEIRRDVSYPKVTDVLRMIEHADRIGFDRGKTSLQVVVSVKETGGTNVVRRTVNPVALILAGSLDDSDNLASPSDPLGPGGVS